MKDTPCKGTVNLRVKETAVGLGKRQLVSKVRVEFRLFKPELFQTCQYSDDIEPFLYSTFDVQTSCFSLILPFSTHNFSLSDL